MSCHPKSESNDKASNKLKRKNKSWLKGCGSSKERNKCKRLPWRRSSSRGCKSSL